MSENSEIPRIVEEIRSAFDGEAWHGPSLMELLADVNAKTAASRPIAGAHTIWELTLHIQAWEEVIRRRLGGEALTLSDAENFPNISDNSEAAWKKALEELKSTHKALLATVRGMSDDRLGGRRLVVAIPSEHDRRLGPLIAQPPSEVCRERRLSRTADSQVADAERGNRRCMRMQDA